MYFLEQIKNQFFLYITLFVGPESAWEIVDTPETPNTVDTPTTFGELWEKAHDVVTPVDDAVIREEARDLIPQTDTERVAALESMNSVERAAAELAMDALQPWEDPNVGTDLTPDEVASTQASLEAQIANQERVVLSYWEWTPERVYAEQRLTFSNSLLNSWAQALQWGWVGWLSMWTPVWTAWDVLQTSEMFTDANNWQWLHESDSRADALFLDWKDADEVPWCAWYVNKVLEMSNFQGTWSLMARSFLACTWEPVGKWHVWFMTPDKKCAWWNQWNKACIQNITKPIEWWVMPEDVWNPQNTFTRTKNGANKVHPDNIPAWAIIVFKRWWGNTWA